MPEFQSQRGGEPDLVAARTPSGQVYLLLRARKETCGICRYGVRFMTLWTSPLGDLQQISWCRSCFNADCDPVEPDESLEAQRRGILQRLRARPHYHAWPGARHAIDELERRGLV